MTTAEAASDPGAPSEGGHRFPRLLGHYRGDRPGPTVLVTGGIHGNEPAGALAAARVMERLRTSSPPLRGSVLALAGNLPALAVDRRYLGQDLNRVWRSRDVAALREQDPAQDGPEQAEQRALLVYIDEAEKEAADGHGLVVLDLHTTSSGGPPFSLMSDTLRNRPVAFSLPVPVILGLEESVDGTLLQYLTERGHRALVVESGRHDDPHSVDRHEAVIWIGLVASGCLEASSVPNLATYRRLLRDACGTAPRVSEVRYRHSIEDGDDFHMEAGFEGFDEITTETVLAHDCSGPVRSPQPGRLLMPLYQEQGNDGFFVVSPVRRVWLWVSALVRKLRLDVLVQLLPGVRRHPDRPYTLVVDRDVARWFVVEIFHLFGFRQRRPEGSYLLFTKRRDD